jgi:hypothetical protein
MKTTPDHVGAVARIGKPRDETGIVNARQLLRRRQNPDPAGNVQAGLYAEMK